jgi:hypothetical protein
MNMDINVIDTFGGSPGSMFSVHCGEDVTGDGVTDHFGSAMLRSQFSIPAIQFDPATAQVSDGVLFIVGTGSFSGYTAAGPAVRNVPCVATAKIGVERTHFEFHRLSGELLSTAPAQGYKNSEFSNINGLPMKDVLSSPVP